MRKTATKRPPELEYTPENCHAREMLARIGDKWSVYVIHVLGAAGTLRFNELRSEVEGISQRMLTVTLRGMERDGLVVRTVYPEVPPRVDYTLRGSRISKRAPWRSMPRKVLSSPATGLTRSAADRFIT